MSSAWCQRYLDVPAIDAFFGALAAGRETLSPGGWDGCYIPWPGYSRPAAAPSYN
jgi:hypothetical protein